MEEQKLQDKESLVKRINALKISLKSLNSSYEKLVKDLFQILTKKEIANRQEEMNNLNKKLNNVLNNETIMNEEIKVLSINLNSNFLNKIMDEKRKIRREYRESSKGIKIAFGIDGNPIKVEDKERYDSLVLLEKLLKEPIYDIEVIGDIATNKAKKEEVLGLLEKLNMVVKDENNKEVIMEEELVGNVKLVKELEEYLDSLAKKISDYEGMAGLPIKETKQVDDKKWVVLASDVEECNLIIEILKILKVSREDTIKVWDIASVKKDLVASFKKYVNGTKYFANMVPKIPENEIKIKEIKDRLGKLIKRAKDNNALGLVLANDKKEYDLLNKEYCYLVSAQASDNLVLYDGVKLEPKYVSGYEASQKELQIIRENDKIEQENANNELAQKRIQERVLEFSNIMPSKGLVRINKEQDV